MTHAAGRFWPTAEVRQDEYRGAGMRAEAAGRVIRGIISATDPIQPVAFSLNFASKDRIWTRTIADEVLME